SRPQLLGRYSLERSHVRSSVIGSRRRSDSVSLHPMACPRSVLWRGFWAALPDPLLSCALPRLWLLLPNRLSLDGSFLIASVYRSPNPAIHRPVDPLRIAHRLRHLVARL